MVHIINMSLLIASSSKGARDTNQIGVQVPYQFRNNLKNPLIVEPNSEIAVESVKINRVPQIDYGGGIVSNFWFGERLTENALDSSISYYIPTENTIDEGSSPLDFAEKFKKVLQEAYSLHPEIDSQSIEVTINTDAIGGFSGFLFNIPQVGSAQGTSTIPPAETRTQEDTSLSDGVLDWDGTTFEADGGSVLGQLMPINDQGGPLSLHNGSCTFDDFAGDNWTVGISRPIGVQKFGTQLLSQDMEDLFGFGANTAAGDVGPYGFGLMDYCAQVGEDNKLRLYHAVADTSMDGTGGKNPSIRMEEIIYYQKNDGAFSANNSTNSSFATGAPLDSSKITDITFIANGEKLEIQASGQTVVACNTINASTKGQIPKPIGQNEWKMYPTVYLWEDGDTLDLARYECRTGTTIYNNQPENSWVSRATIPTILGNGSGLDQYDQLDAGVEPEPAWRNAITWPYELGSRPAYQVHDADSNSASSSFVRDYKTFTANSIVEDYENIFIMGPSERYMDRRIQVWQPNSMEVLGFSPFAINPDSGMVHGAFDGASFSSATRPSMLSAQSTFIRVPTLTHETYNFGTGNPSKILFQVPRFDNSGTETGALFFQNPDKTYVSLNNTHELRITDLDVHFVRKDETFAKDLTGSSEVVFHIRKAKM
jgi:hypothetical protein